MKKWAIAAKIAAAVVGAIVFVLYFNTPRTKPSLMVATWEGDYGHAQRSSQIVPFGAVSGVDALFTSYSGGTKELAAQVAAKSYKWDVVDLEYPDAVAACQSGLLEKIDPSDLPAGPDGTPAAEDFVPGAIGPCWVASAVYAQVIAVSAVRTKGVPPPTLSAFFDPKTFPGKRALNQASAKLNVEMALLADGVAPQDVYDVLSHPQGVARALKKLDTLRGNLLWYTSPADGAAMVIDGRASYASLPNWAVFDADSDARGPQLAIGWDHQLYELEVFGIPRGNPKAARAMDFVRFATRPEVLGRLSSWVPYGPARKSAVALVGPQPELKLDMTPYLPTAHFDTASAVDDSWWRLHGADVDQLWQEWLTKSDPH
jgi:putative spermidine/putrescine transport system substrate-binding protein